MKLKAVFLLFFITVTGNLFSSEAENTTRRFGIFIGSNNGGRDRVMLKFAVTDARSISSVFAEMGGIANEDSVLLAEPSVREINRHIDEMHEQVLRARGNNRRTEIIFYYSGHSDEEGLLLNREMYTYRDLRNRISGIPADMRIVILDSCASGAFTRLKGGEKTFPFLMDGSFTAEGHAFLTSSSANEASQESDRISASFFTYSLVAGLRGAADSVGDGRVTLNELYRYAYTETLARTETSLHGAQHPNYDIQINGSGDLVLTDVSQTTAGIVFDEKITGRLSIRGSRDQLIAEITKTTRPLELGLGPGAYRITLQQGSDVLRADVVLAEGRRTKVSIDNFSKAGTETTRRRGEAEAGSKSNLYTFFFNVVYEPFIFPLIGFVNINIGSHKILQVSFVNWNTADFSGFQTGFVNTAGGNFSGFQAGFVNTVAGDFSGFQTGFVNINAGETKGAQVGFVNTSVKEMIGPQIGFVNVAIKPIKGIQLGLVNYADSINGIPVGFISIVRKGGYQAVEYSFSELHTYNVAFKIGIDKFYTNIIFAYNQTSGFSWDNFATGLGFGSMIPIIKEFLYINPELNSLSSFNEKNNVNSNSFVLYTGCNIGKFNIAAGPSLTWIRANGLLDRKPLNEISQVFSLYSYDINEYNRLLIGARLAVRFRF
ncbi:MAG: caspase family protein [Treponema sp.]|nr:caspase family protein [Treponema sp.]